MNNGRENAETNPYASMPLIQNQDEMHAVHQSSSVNLQLTYDETHTKSDCGTYHIKYDAAALAVLLCLIQLGSWIGNIVYFDCQYLFIYDIWCTIYTACFILAQYTKKPIYMAPIRIHFTILPVISAFGAVLSLVGVIASATVKVLAERNQNPFLPDKNLDRLRSESILALIVSAAALLVFLSCCAMFVGILQDINKFDKYLKQLQKQRKIVTARPLPMGPLYY